MSRHLLVELYDILEQQPKSIPVRELILEQWIRLGDKIEAIGVAKEIRELDPKNVAAKAYLNAPEASSAHARPRPYSPPSALEAKAKSSTVRDMKRTSAGHGQMVRSDAERAIVETSFEQDYRDLLAKATVLNEEMLALKAVRRFDDDDDVLKDLQAIASGHVSSVVSRRPPRPVRELARDLCANPTRCLDLVIDDFNEVIQWEVSENPTVSGEAVRRRLLARQALLTAATPRSLHAQTRPALMHTEHELRHPPALRRAYANDRTMVLAEPVVDIPRDRFLATEDNYAWDVEELASALAAGGGVMRNPLSREVFSAEDVERILSHPLGRRLRPLRLEQDELILSGVRAETVGRIARLSQAMLADQSADAGESMRAVDEFLAFVATLPGQEQRALERLKCPARDAHTGQDYDYTVAEAVRDAKGNRTCFHKTGDFLGQAAKYLQAAERRKAAAGGGAGTATKAKVGA